MKRNKPPWERPNPYPTPFDEEFDYGKPAKPCHELFEDHETRKSSKPIKTIKEKPMFNEIKDKNLQAVKQAAKIEVGTAANLVLINKVRGQLPMMARGYADHPLFQVALANAVAAGIGQFMPDNKKANLVSEAMLEASMLSLVQSFNFVEMIEEMVNGVNLDKPVEEDQNE